MRDEDIVQRHLTGLDDQILGLCLVVLIRVQLLVQRIIRAVILRNGPSAGASCDCRGYSAAARSPGVQSSIAIQTVQVASGRIGQYCPS